MNQEFSDQVKGILFGQAIGDALGFGTEGMRKVEIKSCIYNFLLESDTKRAHGSLKFYFLI